MGVAVPTPLTIPGPVQEKVAPGVEEKPFKTTEVTAQVSTLSVPAAALGKETLVVTTAWSVLEHPLEGSVTVSVYVPRALTVGVAVPPPLTMPGPAQEKVAPGVEEEPLSATEEMAQVSALSVPALTLGSVVLIVAVTGTRSPSQVPTEQLA